MRNLSRFRKPAVALVVALILLAGGLPNDSAPLNFVHWSGANGLRFEGQSQVVSETSLWLKGGAFTLEVWLSPDQPLGIGNQEILSFVDGPGVRPLVLGQWSKGFLLRSRVQNPEGLPSRDRYGPHLAPSPLHLAILGQGDKARLFVAGEVTQVAVAMPEMPLGGRLLLGSSATGWQPWRGEIRAVAIYDRAIGSEEIRRHASGQPNTLLSDPASEPGLVAFYSLDQLAGTSVESLRVGAPALLLPERVSRPSPAMLRFKFEAHQGWFRWDAARNLLAFLPLGLIVAWQRGRSGAWLALAAGFALSFVVEISQMYIAGRHSSATDLMTNTLGAALGAGLALWLSPRSAESSDSVGGLGDGDLPR